MLHPSEFDVSARSSASESALGGIGDIVACEAARGAEGEGWSFEREGRESREEEGDGKGDFRKQALQKASAPGKQAL